MQNILLVDKYKPSTLSEIIGNGSVIKELQNYLLNFKKISDSRKAVLLAGPPGIGKTTLAHIVSSDLGFDVIEFNASDVRNKSAVNERISSLIQNYSVVNSLQLVSTNRKKNKTSNLNGNKESSLRSVSKKSSVIVMDEIDGMSSGDRGGITELITLIKRTKIPMILICNDKNDQKLRSLLNYAKDLRVRRPSVVQIVPRMMKIALREGISVSKEELVELVSSCGNDIRNILNTFALWKTSGKSAAVRESAKDVGVNLFSATAALFKVRENVLNGKVGERNEVEEIREKKKLYFSDYSMIPLMVSENYIKQKSLFPPRTQKVSPSINSSQKFISKSNMEIENRKKQNNKFLNMLKNNFLFKTALAADSISYADTLDSIIKKTQNYAYLNQHSLFSSIYPASLVGPNFGGQMLQFSSFFGNLSKRNKNLKQLVACLEHTAFSSFLSLKESKEIGKVEKSSMRAFFDSEEWGLELGEFRMIRAEYIDRIWISFLKKGNVEMATQLSDRMSLMREDFININLIVGGNLGSERAFANLPSKVKSALTRKSKETNVFRNFGEGFDVLKTKNKKGNEPKKKVKIAVDSEDGEDEFSLEDISTEEFIL